MDKKDRMILYELDKDSRISFAQIGKTIGMSPLTVRYRINKMKEEGIIQKFVTIINTTKLGYSFYKLQLKLQNVDEKKKNKIIEFLNKNPKISWIASFQGQYDLAFIATVKNQLELQQLLDSLHKQFSSFIMKKNISINLKGEFLSRDSLVDKKRTQIRESSYEAFGEIEKVDNLDLEICEKLAENSRTPIVEIADKLKISEETAVKRIKDLRKRDIISGYTIQINNEKLNQIHYKILFHLSDVSDEKINKFLNFIKTNNQVFAIIKVLADWDYEIDLEVGSAKELKQFILELGNEFSNTIKDYEVIQVLEMPKYFTFSFNKTEK